MRIGVSKTETCGEGRGLIDLRVVVVVQCLGDCPLSVEVG